MDRPVFTVILTTYNRCDVVPEAIASVLRQTFPDYELFVVDNGSTDVTRQVVEQFRDARLTYVCNPNPTTSCEAPRNLGIQMARGALISFLDDDDIWYPERLREVKAAFEAHPDAQVVCHSENRRTGGKLDGVLHYGPLHESVLDVLLYERICLSPCATTIKAEVLRTLNGFALRADMNRVADYDLWLRMAASGVKIHFLEKPLGEFRMTGGNLSVVDAAADARVAYIAREHMLQHEQRPLHRISKRGMSRLFRLYYVAGRSYLRGGDLGNALRSYGEAAQFLFYRPTLLGSVFRALIRTVGQKSRQGVVLAESAELSGRAEA
jgi:glycosyltransferase involved in cell wall biosynthesis